MIKNLYIENFRGFESFKMEDLGRITLISGKNNIGKSTLLEALFLMMDHTSNDSFMKINGFRGSSISGIQTLWEPLFYALDTDRQITIKMNDSDSTLCLVYKKDQDYIPAEGKGVPDEILAQFRTATKNAYSLFFAFDKNDYHEEGHFSMNGISSMRQISTSLAGNEIMTLKPTQYINSTFARMTDNVLDGIGKLELKGEKDLIIRILRELDPSVDDILTLAINGLTQLYLRKEGRLIPLQYAGDGIMKLLNICLAIIERKDGLLLIDEVETGLHYSMYKKLWSIIDKLSENSRCQIVATTHSYELISAVKDGIERPSDFSYFRIGQRKNGISSFRYSYEMLSDALLSEMEVR